MVIFELSNGRKPGVTVLYHIPCHAGLATKHCEVIILGTITRYPLTNLTGLRLPKHSPLIQQMTKQSIILTFLLISLWTFQTKADSWKDPTWKKMIEESDVIVLVEYTSSGDFQARAKPITIYKGLLNTEYLWISGFSNRYGPIDKMQPGDRYIVFLKRNQLTEGNIEYLEEKIKEEPALTTYFEALKEGKAYHVWTPTSGDLKVQGKEVQYDLLQTSYYANQSFHALDEFEKFLNASTKVNKHSFHKRTLKKLRANTKNIHAARYLMMLYLSDFQSFEPIFQVIADEQKPESCYALAQLLGEVSDSRSRDILVQLLENENSIVQGEAVRQLSDQEPEFIGPILLSRLTSAGEEGIYPSNIMDPVANRIDGGKVEIIKTLGKLKYKPAARQLLPLLETEDDYIFKLVVDVLIDLGSKDFVPYINDHLKKKTKSLIFEICQIITDNNLNECKQALMEFISSHNRNDHPGYEYSISSYMGLAHFDDEETRDFLMRDFKNLMTRNDTIESGKLERWIRKYIETFTSLKHAEARPLIYNSLFKWFGYNQDFALHPELFNIKQSLEYSLNRKAMDILKSDFVKGVESIVFITNTNHYGPDFIPEYDQLVLVRLEYTKLGLSPTNDVWSRLREVKEKLNKELEIPLEKIGSRSGSYVSNLNSRFSTSIDFSPMSKFYKYARELPDENDLIFLKSLAKSGFTEKDFDRKQLNKTIKAIEEGLKN